MENNINEGTITSGDNVSYSIDSTPLLGCETANTDHSTEILIIGGGIAGLSTAYKLLRAGKKVTRN